MTKHKIVIVEIAARGGICHYTYNLANALSYREKVQLITGKNYELMDEKRNFELVELFNGVKTSPFFLFKFIRNIKEGGGICHFQLSQYPIFVLVLIVIAKIFYKKAIVVTAHNVVSHEKIFWETVVYYMIYRLSDRIIVHAQENKKKLLTYFLIDKDKIAVIPHGNYMFFDVKIAPLFSLNNSCRILFFGFIRKYKGLKNLVRAVAKVKNVFPDVKLIIAGKPVGGFEEYQSEIDRCALNDNVDINLGYIPSDKIGQFFQSADLVALPYEEISQSGIVHLAYSFGKPVVATKVGGLPEVIHDGKSGLLVNPGNVDDLADKLILLLKDKDLRKKMGEYALNLAETVFSWEDIARKTNELYREVRK